MVVLRVCKQRTNKLTSNFTLPFRCRFGSLHARIRRRLLPPHRRGSRNGHGIRIRVQLRNFLGQSHPFEPGVRLRRHRPIVLKVEFPLSGTILQLDLKFAPQEVQVLDVVDGPEQGSLHLQPPAQEAAVVQRRPRPRTVERNRQDASGAHLRFNAGNPTSATTAAEAYARRDRPEKHVIVFGVWGERLGDGLRWC